MFQSLFHSVIVLAMKSYQVSSDPFFADYSLMINLIEKENREMKLDIYRIVEIIFSPQYVVLYRLGLDGILTCF